MLAGEARPLAVQADVGNHERLSRKRHIAGDAFAHAQPDAAGYIARPAGGQRVVEFVRLLIDHEQ